MVADHPARCSGHSVVGGDVSAGRRGRPMRSSRGDRREAAEVAVEGFWQRARAEDAQQHSGPTAKKAMLSTRSSIDSSTPQRSSTVRLPSTRSSGETGVQPSSTRAACACRASVAVEPLPAGWSRRPNAWPRRSDLAGRTPRNRTPRSTVRDRCRAAGRRRRRAGLRSGSARRASRPGRRAWSCRGVGKKRVT